MDTTGAPLWVRVILPAGVAVAVTIGGASWRTSLSNEHRLTTMEDRAETILSLVAREAAVEVTLAKLVEETAALRGATEERNRNEGLRVGAENARVQAEGERSHAESSRGVHERTRDSNENKRVLEFPARAKP